MLAHVARWYTPVALTVLAGFRTSSLKSPGMASMGAIQCPSTSPATHWEGR